MIRRLRIVGLGPIKELAIDGHPDALLEVRGASQSGKSTIGHALAFVLWGSTMDGQAMPGAWVRDDEPRALVELTLASGTTFQRAMTSKRSQRLGLNGETVKPAAFREALGDLGDRDLVAPILLPGLLWQLARGPGHGRPLRDWIVRLLELDVDEVALATELLGAPLPTGVVNEKAATEHRLQARRDVDRLEGQAAADEAARDALEAAIETHRAKVAPATIADARSWLDLEAAWQAHDDSIDALEEWGRRAEEVVAWDMQREALGDPPAAEQGDRREELRAARRDAAQRVEQLRSELAVARSKAGRPTAAAGKCPTCAQPWPGGVAASAAAVAEQRRAAADVERLEAALSAAAEVLRAAEVAADAAADAPSPLAAWQVASQLLGPRPEVGDEPRRVEPPADDRPTADELEAARRAWAAALAADEALAALEPQLEAATARQAATASELEAARAAFAFAERVVDAYRRAPSAAVERLRAATAELGPLDVLWRSDGGVELMIDGLPAELASTGRRIAADALARAALRAAAGFDWLPLVVDERQSWSGSLDVAGPAIVLRTTAGALEVSNG